MNLSSNPFVLGVALKRLPTNSFEEVFFTRRFSRFPLKKSMAYATLEFRPKNNKEAHAIQYDSIKVGIKIQPRNLTSEYWNPVDFAPHPPHRSVRTASVGRCFQVIKFKNIKEVPHGTLCWVGFALQQHTGGDK